MQDAVVQRGRRVPEHGEVLKVQIRGVDEEQPLWSLDRRDASTLDGVGAFLKATDHFVGVKGWAHRQMLGQRGDIELVVWTLNSVLWGCGRRQVVACGQ